MAFTIDESRHGSVHFDLTVTHTCGHVSTSMHGAEKDAQAAGKWQEQRLCPACAKGLRAKMEGT